tara:strand:- start:88 stop:756 length:669 start_codon:yes stop_codon:yes gene_type:complete
MFENLRYELRSKYRSSEYFIYFNKVRYPKKCINKNTNITIDGFERSANTYSLYYFKELNKDTKIAHHSHSYQQMIHSLEKKIPTILLIRNPYDAIISSYIYHFQKVPVQLLADTWINFYKPLIPFKDNLIVSDFNTTISNFSKIISLANDKYDTKFNYVLNENHNKILQEKLNERKIKSNRQSMPSIKQKKVKEKISSNLLNALESYDYELNDIYNRFRSET